MWRLLHHGGNAIDAAIATAFALAVTLPEAGNIGGGGFIVAYLADRREVVTVDFREMAPQAAGRKCTSTKRASFALAIHTGAWAAGVPGAVQAWDWRTQSGQEALGRPGPARRETGPGRISDLRPTSPDRSTRN